MTLVEFLLARIAEDEQRAHAIHDRLEDRFSEPDLMGVDCACGVPKRWLAECTTKRDIIAGYDEIEHPPGPLYELASVYADHPDYADIWTWSIT